MMEEKKLREQESLSSLVEKKERKQGEPTAAYKGATWAALLLGVISYLVDLYNATMELNEKGYYLIILIFGLYAAISLMAIGLYNAGSIILSEKGFYAMAFALSLFAAITLQKNIRDAQEVDGKNQ